MTVIRLSKAGESQATANSGQLVAALDIGSTKIGCLIGETVARKHRAPEGDETPKLRVLGIGHQASRGIRNGTVVDVDQAERAIRLAVDQAERMAKRAITEVYVNVSGGRPRSTRYAASVKTTTGQVMRADCDAAIAGAVTQIAPGKRRVIHVSPLQYHLDDARGITTPLGMHGDLLAVDVNAVCAEQAALRNLSLVVERCHLAVAGYAIAPYAAARSVLAPDEMKLGSTLIDIGGATTGIAVFRDGHLAFADVAAVGGYHITSDLARGLSTTIAHAERMKTLYGNAIPSIVDEREMVAVPLLGERGVDTVHHVPRSMLTGIIRPRLEEMFEMIRDRLGAAGTGNGPEGPVVITGGTSQLTGIREMAQQWLNRTVRLGSPHPLEGLPDAASTPAFAVAAGLLAYALKPDQHLAAASYADAATAEGRSYLRRVGRWIAESF
jgi:cell division protein FtsA